MTGRFLGALVTAAVLCACGGGGSSGPGPSQPRPQPSASVNANAFMQAQTPKSVLPNTVAAPAMPQTSVQTASAMSGVRQPQSAITPLGFTQIPGGAQAVAVSPDGSIWVVSNAYGGPNGNLIWHYANGAWTNIPGVATRLAVAPDASLWAVNATGGIYHYANGAWSTIAGGASDISVGADGSVFVISNAAPGPYGSGIYHYANGAWTQLPGAAVRIAASWDAGTYSYNIAPGGFYVVNAQQSIFYWNPTSGFMQIPSDGAIAVAATTNGGLFALGGANSPNGNPIFYNDLSTRVWTQQPGAGVAIATNGSSVYVIGIAGGIYQAPVTVPTASPTASPSPSPSPSPSASPSASPSPTASSTLSPLVFNPPASVELTQSPLSCPTPLPSGNYCSPTVFFYNFVAVSQVGGYARPFTATVQNPNIAVQETCSPNQLPPPTTTCIGNASDVSFQGFQAGKTAVTITGANNITAPYTVYVTLTTVRVHIRNLPTAYSITWSTSNFGFIGGNNNTYGAAGTAVLPQPANGSDFNLLNVSLPGSLPGSITVSVSDGAHTLATSTVGGSGTSVPPFIVEGQQNYVDVTPQ